MEAVYRRLETFFATKENAPLTAAEAAVCAEWIDALREDQCAPCAPWQSSAASPAQWPGFSGDAVQYALPHDTPVHALASNSAANLPRENTIASAGHCLPSREAEAAHSSVSFATAMSGHSDTEAMSEEHMHAEPEAASSLDVIPEHSALYVAPSGEGFAGHRTHRSASAESQTVDPEISELRAVQSEIRSILAGDTAGPEGRIDIERQPELSANANTAPSAESQIAASAEVPATTGAHGGKAGPSRTALEILRALDGSSSDEDEGRAEAAETSDHMSDGTQDSPIEVLSEAPPTPRATAVLVKDGGTPLAVAPATTQTADVPENTQTPGRTPRRTPRTTPLPRSLESSPQDALVHIGSSTSDEDEKSDVPEGDQPAVFSLGARQPAPEVHVPRDFARSDPFVSADAGGFAFDLSSVSERRFPATDDVPEYAFDV